MKKVQLDIRDLYTQKKITRLQQALEQAEKNTKLFKGRLVSQGDSQPLQYQLQRWQSVQLQLKEELKLLGVTEKRGRPKKAVDEKYKAKRVKFTAHLLPENHEYIKQLKANGQIQNISSFLDDLIEQHKKVK